MLGEGKEEDPGHPPIPGPEQEPRSVEKGSQRGGAPKRAGRNFSPLTNALRRPKAVCLSERGEESNEHDEFDPVERIITG